ncbi:imidazole glycerol phosphate synthase subunit HisH, partial [mine drainage metagenome]
MTVRRPGELDRSDAAIFPGVGAAGAAMSRLRRSGLERALVAFLKSGRPYLGICLGLQLLFQASAEDGSPCLDVLAGQVVKLPTTEKLPHVGWNTIELLRPCSLLDG